MPMIESSFANLQAYYDAESMNASTSAAQIGRQAGLNPLYSCAPRKKKKVLLDSRILYSTLNNKVTPLSRFFFFFSLSLDRYSTVVQASISGLPGSTALLGTRPV
jgi:hypothetical protein